MEKTAWYWQSYKHIENIEIDPHINDELIKKTTTTTKIPVKFNGEERVSSANSVKTSGHFYGLKWTLTFTSKP